MHARAKHADFGPKHADFRWRVVGPPEADGFGWEAGGGTPKADSLSLGGKGGGVCRRRRAILMWSSLEVAGRGWLICMFVCSLRQLRQTHQFRQLTAVETQRTQ